MLLVEPGVRPLDRDALALLGHQLREIPAVAAVSLATDLPGNSGGAGDPRKGGGAAIAAMQSAHEPASSAAAAAR